MIDDVRSVGLSQDVVRELIDAFVESDWLEMTVTVGDDRLYLARPGDPGGAAIAPVSVRVEAAAGKAPARAPAPREGSPAETRAEGQPVLAGQMHAEARPPTGSVVESPSVGLFWHAPSPNAPPFVEVGARVAVGDTLAIVEVMKLMNQLVSPVHGVVKAILAENGATVQFGQPLVVIDPEA